MQQLLLLELQELELLLQLQVKHEREKQMAAPPLLPRSNVTSPNLGFTKCDWLFALFFFFCMFPTGMDNLETQVMVMETQMEDCFSLRCFDMLSVCKNLVCTSNAPSTNAT